MTASVAPTYEHRDKFCTPGESLGVSGAALKWYDVAPTEMAVPDEIRAMARAYVQRLEIAGDFGFVILHRCGGDFYFLIVQTWLNENEIWESVYAKRNADDPGFALWPRPGPHLPTYCVWELGAVWREQQAWRRYLMSARDETAKRAWLADVFEGAV